MEKTKIPLMFKNITQHDGYGCEALSEEVRDIIDSNDIKIVDFSGIVYMFNSRNTSSSVANQNIGNVNISVTPNEGYRTSVSRGFLANNTSWHFNRHEDSGLISVNFDLFQSMFSSFSKDKYNHLIAEKASNAILAAIKCFDQKDSMNDIMNEKYNEFVANVNAEVLRNSSYIYDGLINFFNVLETIFEKAIELNLNPVSEHNNNNCFEYLFAIFDAMDVRYICLKVYPNYNGASVTDNKRDCTGFAFDASNIFNDIYTPMWNANDMEEYYEQNKERLMSILPYSIDLAIKNWTADLAKVSICWPIFTKALYGLLYYSGLDLNERTRNHLMGRKNFGDPLVTPSHERSKETSSEFIDFFNDKTYNDCLKYTYNSNRKCYVPNSNNNDGKSEIYALINNNPDYFFAFANTYFLSVADETNHVELATRIRSTALVVINRIEDIRNLGKSINRCTVTQFLSEIAYEDESNNPIVIFEEIVKFFEENYRIEYNQDYSDLMKFIDNIRSALNLVSERFGETTNINNVVIYFTECVLDLFRRMRIINII